MSRLAACPLCARADDGATLDVVETPLLRVVRVLDAPEFPAFYRVIWGSHAVEFSDLSADDRSVCMEAVVAVERVLRHVAPTKINLAALGNVVPHLHWHVIARFAWDSHFPQPIWGQRQREVTPPAGSRMSVPLDELDAKIRWAIQGHPD